MTSAVLTPFVKDPAASTGDRTWRKRLLPIGTIRYKDRVLNFTKDYLAGLAASFKSSAYDQVPFQLAPDDNRHTNDVERFAGDITNMAVEPDGLWITLSATERGDKMLRENPRCGVSARIVEDYDRSDGKWFGAAVQHVLATLDPRIPGLGGWTQAVGLSSDHVAVLDLSNYEFSGDQEGSGMPEQLTEEQKAERMAKLLEIPPEQIEQLLAGIANAQPPAGTEGEGADEDDLVAWIDSLSDAELEALEAEWAAEGQGAEPAPAQLSGDQGALEMAIEMNAVRTDETVRQLSVVQTELDDQRYKSEKERLARDSGVPPYITELAKPLLHGSNHVVELSGGTSADAGQIMRKVLTEFGKMTSMLGADVELGSPMDEPEGQGQAEQAASREQFVGTYLDQFRMR